MCAIGTHACLTVVNGSDDSSSGPQTRDFDAYAYCIVIVKFMTYDLDLAVLIAFRMVYSLLQQV